MENNEITVGKEYKMSGVDVVCVGFTKKGHAKMQTLGMTAGRRPGEGNISEYNDVTRHFTKEWKEVIKKFRLPTLKKAKTNKDVSTALAKAAGNYSSFGASNNYAWLGSILGSTYAWCVNSSGYVNSSYSQNLSFVVAPAFNLDESKIILDGDEIKQIEGEPTAIDLVVPNCEAKMKERSSDDESKNGKCSFCSLAHKVWVSSINDFVTCCVFKKSHAECLVKVKQKDKLMNKEAQIELFDLIEGTQDNNRNVALRMGIQALQQQSSKEVFYKDELFRLTKQMYFEVCNSKEDYVSISDCIAYTAAKCRQYIDEYIRRDESIEIPIKAVFCKDEK